MDAGTPNPKKVLNDVVMASAVDYHTVAVKKDGSLWVWIDHGYDKRGSVLSSYYEQVRKPMKIMNNVAYATALGEYGMVLKRNGTLWAWGESEDVGYAFGDNMKLPRSYVPVKIMENVSYVSSSSIHFLVIKNDGTLLFWGSNEYGQVGDKSEYLTTAAQPVRIMDEVLMPIQKELE